MTQEIDQAAETAKTLARTSFTEAEAALLALTPAAAAADRDDPDPVSSATVYDALAEIHILRALGYWRRLVAARRGELGTCWTCDTFPEYCEDRAGLRADDF